MAWIRLDDHIARNHKILQCSPAACWFYVSALGHAQEQLTNGFCADRELPRISHLRYPRAAAEQLARAGLFERIDEPDRKGYQIHDYLEFNDSKEVVLEKRRLLSETRSKAGKNGAMAKWQTVWQTEPSNGDGKPSMAPIPSHPIPLKEKNKPRSTERVVSSKPRPDLPDKAADTAKVRRYDPAIEKAARDIQARERSRSHVRFR